MAKKDYILQELKELQSTLISYADQHTYTVPAGYFEGLTEQVLRRIKALEATTAAEELNHLSRSLTSIHGQMPYTVPAGYFEGLAEQVLRRIKAMEAATVSEELSELSPLLAGLSKKMPYSVPVDYFEQLHTEESAATELASISPLLSGLKKEMPYSVPAGYFEDLVDSVAKKAVKKETKVIAITSRKWFRYAAAAVMVGVIATLAFLKFGNDEPKASQPLAKFEKNLNKEIKKMSEKELNDFLQYSAAGLDGTENVKIDNIDDAKELLKDVSESEMKTFLEETADVEPDAEPVMMN
jgi:hypothetical protein